MNTSSRASSDTGAGGPSTRFAFLAACGLVLAAPFETLRPWAAFPVQELSSLEVILAVALLIGSAEAFSGWFLGRRPHLAAARRFLVPLAILLTAMTASALTAPGHPADAIKFMGRLAAGFAVYLLFSRAVSSDSRLAGLLKAAAAPAALVATLGSLEYLGVHAVQEFLDFFRSGPFYAGTQVRATGTLQYPTITAMYLEVAFGWLLGSLLDAVHRRLNRMAVVLFLGQFLVGAALVFTLTRSALIVVTGLLVCAAVSVCRRPDRVRLLVVVGGLALSIFLALIGSMAFNPEIWLRLTTTDPSNWYRVEYEVPEALTMETGGTREVEVTLHNRGLAPWTPHSDPPFRLGYHWLNESRDRVVEFEGLRTELPCPLPPGGSLTFRALVRAPAQPGRYQLAWDLLQEDRFWFSQEYAPSAYTSVEVTGRRLGPLPPLRPLPRPRLYLSRRDLWTAALKLLRQHPFLGVGPNNFRYFYGPVLGLETADLTYHAHNVYLEFFVGGGLLGGVLFLWLAWRLGRRAVGCLRAGPLLHLGPALAVLAFLGHGMLDSFLEFTPTYVMIFASIACLELPHVRQRRVQHPADA